MTHQPHTIAKPQLTFFCELDPAELETLFHDPTLIPLLQRLHAQISMGLRDLSDTRAIIVRRLNDAGIPVIAWQLLDQAEGYWFNRHNCDAAHARYRNFREWTAEHGLKWSGVGIDIEPNINELDAPERTSVWALPGLARRLGDGESLREAQQNYATLVELMRADGYTIESYVIPFIIDERRVGSSALQRLSGLIQIEVDREVPMLYTSFLGRLGPAILWSYGTTSQAIGLGSTGGGVTAGGLDQIAPLDWPALRRDLLIAARYTNAISIFSLEGCVRQNMLEHIATMHWGAPVAIPATERALVGLLRASFAGLLWLSARPLLAAGLLLIGVISLRRSVTRKNDDQ